MKAAIEWIHDWLEDTEQKLVVFTWHIEILDALYAAFKDVAIRGGGSVPVPQRHVNVQRFQTDPNARLYLGNLRADGVGITLHAASNVAFVEMGWTPGEHDQAEDRVHRIGQEADSINAYYLVAQGTIDETLCATIDKKRQVLTQVLDGKNVDQSTMLTALLENMMTGQEKST